MFLFDFEERDCSLVEGRGCRPERGDGWGDSFQGGPKRALSAQRRSGGRGRQREQKRTGKKGRSAVADMPAIATTARNRERASGELHVMFPRRSSCRVGECDTMFAVTLARAWTITGRDTVGGDDQVGAGDQGVHRGSRNWKAAGGANSPLGGRPGSLRPRPCLDRLLVRWHLPRLV